MFDLCTTKQTISIINSKNKKGAQIKQCESSPHGINLAGNYFIKYTRKKSNKGRTIVCLKSKKKQDEVFNSAFFCRTERIFLELTESINEINTNRNAGENYQSKVLNLGATWNLMVLNIVLLSIKKKLLQQTLIVFET